LCANTALFYGQVSAKSKFDLHYNASVEFNKLSLFSESITELEMAIAIVSENNWREKYLESSIFLGEMMRRTGDQKKGLEVLEKLSDSKKYPKLHVRKLGRMAALYAEVGKYPGRSPKDSLTKYLKIALHIAKKNKFYKEEASLCNELGYFKLHNENIEAAKPYLLRSAKLFKKLNDENNYVVVMCHVLYVNILEGNFKIADTIIKELLDLVDTNNWYGTEQTLYKNIAKRYLIINDSISYYKWAFKEKEAAEQLALERSNQEMSYYRVKYDTEKFKIKVIEAAQKSKAQKNIFYIIFSFMIIFFVLSIIVARLFLKKKKLAQSFEISNEKYQMLMVESNHRIKNNLQMIISLVDYSYDQANTSEKKILNKISGKIQTIGVLHKHFFVDIYNDFVDIAVYFDEIIRLYSKMNSDILFIEKDICTVKINSERIVYFGLILNELLANTMEHNLSEIKKVNISVKPLSKGFLFEYCDNSLHDTSFADGKGSLLLNQLIKRIKGLNYQLDKKTGNHKFEFKNVI
jgi:two-component sensor histidine kinase